jgi:hypothetical protein
MEGYQEVRLKEYLLIFRTICVLTASHIYKGIMFQGVSVLYTTLDLSCQIVLGKTNQNGKSAKWP